MRVILGEQPLWSYVMNLVGLAGLCALCATAWGRGSAEFFVKSLPGFPPDAKFPVMHAGNVTVDPGSGDSLYFWSIGSTYRVSEPKTIIWLNGGPGCSSSDGALLEIGPFRVGKDDQLYLTDGAWSEHANLIFLDQPFGTGFSSVINGNYISELDVAAEKVVGFLVEWLKIFPEHAHDDFYLAGESYAGQYIPYIYKAIKEYARTPDSEPIGSIKGLILGNPWMDSAHQFLSYVPFLKNKGIVTDPTDLANLDTLNERCIDALQKSSEVLPDNNECNRILNYALDHYENKKVCFNIYDYKLEDSYPDCGMNWPPGVEYLSTYMNNPQVRQALHAPERLGPWEECNINVQTHFKATKNPTSSTLLPEILETVPVMIMVGELDVVCNALGLDNMISSLEWGGATERGFLDTERPKLVSVSVDEAPVAMVQEGRNLTMVHVANGTHMLPVNKQVETRMLVHKFIGLTRDYKLEVDTPDPGKAPDPKLPDEERQKTVNEAMRRAYYQAGLTALIVVIVFAVGVLVWMRVRGESDLSLKKLMMAVLHVGRSRKSYNYVRLNTFRPSARPEVIIEEEEEPEDV